MNKIKENVLIIGSGSDLAKETAKCLKTVYNIVKISSSLIDFKNLKNIDKLNFKKKIDHIIFFSAINEPKNFLNYSDQEIANHFNVNVFSIIKILKKIIPSLILQKKNNKIIFISSLFANYGRAKRTPYSSSKAALKNICQSLTVEYGNKITFNCIAPGFVDTKLTRKNISSSNIKKIINKTPIKRLIKKIEVANIVKFLLSDQSNGISGQHIVVDGGISCNGDFS